MKTQYFLLLAGLALALAACEEKKETRHEEEPPILDYRPLQVRFPPTVSPEAIPGFTAKDSLLVCLADGSTRYFYIDPDTAEGVTVTFRGLLKADEDLGDYVYFPGPGFTGVEEGPLQVSYPESYIYGRTAVAPFVGMIPETGSVVLRPLGATLRIDYSSIPSSAAALSVVLGGAVATGAIPVDLGSLTARAPAGSSSTLSVILPEATAESLLIPVPCGNYSGIDICLKDASGAAIPLTDNHFDACSLMTGEVRALRAAYRNQVTASLPAISASAEADSRTLAWKEGDSLVLLLGDGRTDTLRLQKGAGSALGDFGSSPSIEDYTYAFFPKERWSQDETDKSALWYCYPEEYPAYDSTAVTMPVIADYRYAESPGCALYHVGGVIRFKYCNIPAETHGFTVRFNNRDVCAPVSFHGSGPAYIRPRTETAASSTVHLHFAQPSSTMCFYVPVPCGSYDDLTVFLTREDKSPVTGTTKDFHKSDCVITEGFLYVMPTLTLMSIGADLP